MPPKDSVVERCMMPGRFVFPLVLFMAAAFALLWRRRKKKRRARKSALTEDRLLWVGLAAGLFDFSDKPANARIEIALKALARKLRLRGALVTAHKEQGCRILAATESDGTLMADLRLDQTFKREQLFGSSLTEIGQMLVIDYASLSEWRNHAACQEYGWESYVGLNCGEQNGEQIVVSFFDQVPRDQLFNWTEKSLVEQLGPWIAAMLVNGAPLESYDSGLDNLDGRNIG